MFTVDFVEAKPRGKAARLLDESQVLLRVPRKDNIYNVNLKSVVPTRGLTCLFVKATTDESNLWHKRLGHINYKTMNKLVRENLVRGLPSKIFENNHGCVACQKGKQHKASYKAKLVNSISKPLHMIHMDLFGLTNVTSLMRKSYCLVITDDFSRFSWVFFLTTKDETSGILKTFITGIENQLDCKVKVIRCDNRTKFKNSIMNRFYDMKGIQREFSVPRTPHQNGVAERKNRTLIEAARTMLVDSKFPTTFWAEVVNTACYVLNRALVIKPHNKTPYKLIRGKPLLIDFMKPFECPVTILNTRDYLGKFDEKADEGFFVGYSMVSKAMRVFNKRTIIVEETLNIRFLENPPNVKGNRPGWLFDIDSLTISMNYMPVAAGFQTNGIAGTNDNNVACQAKKKKEPEQNYILIPICTTDPLISQGPKDSVVNAGKKATKVDASQVSDIGGQDTRSGSEGLLQQERRTEHINNTNSINTISSPVSTVGPSFVNSASPSTINAAETPVIPIVTLINDTGIFCNAYDDEAVEEEVDMNNVVPSCIIHDAPLTKFLKDHPKDQVIGNIETPVQTRQMTKMNEEHGLISSVQKLRRTNHKDFQNYMFAYYLSQMEPKKPVQALKDPSWVEAMQEELLQLKLLNVWTLVDLPKDKWAIGTKWIFRNKKDERGIVIKNKVRLVAQGHTQEEGIDYDEVFAPVARIKAIRLFLAYASFKDFIVCQMDVKSAFIYKKIEDEVYVYQPPGFKDLDFLDKVYKVEKALYGLHRAPRSCQDKYVADILKNFGFSTVKTASTPMEPNKALVKDVKAKDVDVHLYRSMIGSLMYLTASPDITFIVCACLWYSKDSPFDLEAYSDSDYAGGSLDRKSTIGGCQFLGK
nr:hypothetical protein [Tanacetum cinerariifolium]